jgi:hypothetical protein
MKPPPEDQYAQNPGSGGVGLLPLAVLLASASTLGGVLSVVRDENSTAIQFILQMMAGVLIATAYGMMVAKLLPPFILALSKLQFNNQSNALQIIILILGSACILVFGASIGFGAFKLML